jgi:hypothetical protein
MVMLDMLVKISALIQAVATPFVALTFFLVLYQLRAMQVQLADARRVAQTSQHQAALQLMFDWRSEIIADPSLADGFRSEGFFREVFEAVPPKRYFHNIKLFHIFEYYWLLYHRKIIDDDMWSGWSHNLSLVIKEVESRRIWEFVRGAQTFNPVFVAYVDDILKQPPPPSQSATDTTVADVSHQQKGAASSGG